jgi:hypothetical protein
MLFLITGVAAGTVGLNGVRQLERVGFLLEDAVDLGRAALAMDAQPPKASMR